MSSVISKALVHLQPASNPTVVTPMRGDSINWPYTPVEIAEFVEFARQAFNGADVPRTGSTRHRSDDQPAIYPEDSILADWMDFSRAQEESADTFLLGSIMPVCAALLARRLWFPWGWKRKYPNVFCILTGKPGDRKSSVILLAEALARRILPENGFLPSSFSPESLFDEYADDEGGRPDKLWIVDDANATLKDWQKAVNGERVATRFLELYDCKALSESFRRNKKETAEGKAKRSVPETSTSLLFGATFNIAAFQGQEVRAGMARRFLYYVAERHGRLIERPGGRSELALRALVKGFEPLLRLAGEMEFTKEAAGYWGDFQRQNRDEMDDTDPMCEAALSRLSSAPMQTLSVAMIFEACRHAKSDGPWQGLIQAATLKLAVEHVEACLAAAARLEAISNQAETGQDAEVFLAKIRQDFPPTEGFHFARRSELTKKFCPNSGRAGSWRPNDLYLRFIPFLERRGEARLIDKSGKRKVYAFRAEPSDDPQSPS